MIKKLTLFLSCLFLGTSLIAQTTLRITDGTLQGDTDYNWTADNEYILDGLVYLDSGSTLTIEAGTVIRGATESNITTGDNSSALIITRGARIEAVGTADNPIVFTAEEDVLSDPEDFSSGDRGEWGGLIILGSATIARPGGEDRIEGIDPDEDRIKFGGGDTPNDDDDSGILRYVSIRHGGAVLADGDEINGLTLGGVGRGTDIDYVEVFANADDGIEFFGGTVDVKHATVAFCKDDGFDWDFGWRGRGQFWFVIQEPGTDTGHAGEHDGASPDDTAPFAQPTIYNATYVGIGNGATASGGDAAESPIKALLMRDNTGGFYYNSIFTGYNGIGVVIEDRDDTETTDAFARFEAGDLAFTGNIFEDFAGGSTAAELIQVLDQTDNLIAANSATVAAAFAANNTFGGAGTSGVANIGRTPGENLDPRINANGSALAGGEPSDDSFFNGVTYRGAFGNTTNWLSGWTALENMGYLGDEVEAIDNFDCVVIRDGDLAGDTEYNWDSNTCYTLDGLVYLDAGSTLNIPAGTIIRGSGPNDITTGDNTSALIITRGATINAIGTEDAPIIFTALEDDLDDDLDFTAGDRGEWGGLIILGGATIARPAGTDRVEGIDPNEDRVVFGGGDNPNDAESSGTLRYVSIRHGGAVLADGDEINGLTLAGVGSGTDIDFVEVYANDDDGIEFFGGTVRIDHAAVAYCKDDSYDWDYGWRGAGQYWFSIQAPNSVTGHAGEHDGASPDDVAPFAQPVIYNATYVGIGSDADADGGDAAENPLKAILMRDNTGGYYNNSIFTDFNGAAVVIEDRDDTEVDAFSRLVAGDLGFNNNIFCNFGAGDSPEDLFFVIDQNDGVVSASSATMVTDFMNSGNVIACDLLNQTERDEDGNGLDVRPLSFGLAGNGAPVPTDADFATEVYYGAFAPGNGDSNRAWISGWTAVGTDGSIDDDFLNDVGTIERNGMLLEAPVPNPAANVATVNFELTSPMNVEITILDITGRPVAFREGSYTSGRQFETFNTSQLANGNYIVLMRAGGARLVQKLIVNK